MDVVEKNKMLFLRGARVVKILEEYDAAFLLETTYDELEQNIVNGFPRTKKRQHAIDPIQVTQLKLIPYVGTRSLYIKALARNITNSHKYDTQVFFADVQYEEENTSDNITFTANDQKQYNIQPIELSTNNIRCRCTCLDFYHRFANQNFSDKSLWGVKPRRYIPVSPPSGRPPVNPTNVPGLCKHLIKTIMALRDAKIVIQ